MTDMTARLADLGRHVGRRIDAVAHQVAKLKPFRMAPAKTRRTFKLLAEQEAPLKTHLVWIIGRATILVELPERWALADPPPRPTVQAAPPWLRDKPVTPTEETQP